MKTKCIANLLSKFEKLKTYRVEMTIAYVVFAKDDANMVVSRRWVDILLIV